MLGILINVVLSGCYGSIEMLPRGKEPVCDPRYGFESRVLEKLLRMELEWETMKTRSSHYLDELGKHSTHFKEEFENMKQSYDAKLKEMDDTIDNVKDEANEQLKEISKKAEEKLSLIKDLPNKDGIVFHVQNVNEQPSADSVIKFEHVVENTDDVYDVITGRFTAPVRGTYWFSAQLCADKKKLLSPSLFINEGLVARTLLYYGDDRDCATVSVVSILNKGDNVSLKAGPSSGSTSVWIRNNHYHVNAFMGALMF